MAQVLTGFLLGRVADEGRFVLPQRHLSTGKRPGHEQNKQQRCSPQRKRDILSH